MKERFTTVSTTEYDAFPGYWVYDTTNDIFVQADYTVANVPFFTHVEATRVKRFLNRERKL